MSDTAGRIVTPARELADEYWQWRLRNRPEFATLIGCHDFDDQLDCQTLQAYQDRKQACQDFLQRVRKIQDTELNEDDTINLILLEHELDLYLKGFDLKGYFTPVAGAEDIRLYFRHVINNMNYNNEEDYQKLFTRLDNFPEQMSNFIILMQEGLKEGITHHPTVMQASITSLEEFLNEAVEDTPFYKPFLQLKNVQAISAERKGEIEQKGFQMVKNNIQGSFQKLVDFLKDEYIPNVRRDLACLSMPNGKAYYEASLRFFVTWDVTPREVFDMGLAEVKRIRDNMQKVMKQVGFDGSISEFHEFLRQSKQFYSDTKEEYINAFRDALAKVRLKIPEYFKTNPSLELRIEELDTSAKNLPVAFYFGPSHTGARPGTVFVNLTNYTARPKYEIMALTLHEAEPGHHLQSSYSLMLDQLPGYRRLKDERQYCTAPSRFPHHSGYVEGWAMYCEFLGEEMGMYEGDPYSLFGRYCQEIQRACRLVVDPGLHVFGWSKKQAADYINENLPMSHDFIESELTRYVACPGQACPYTIGLIKFKEFRQRAEDKLGEKFDIRDFHDAVLSCGLVPLTVLEKIVDRYIEKTLKTSH